MVPLVGVLILLGPLAPRAATSMPTVVLLSLDGIRYDYPNRVRGGAFSRLEREGVRARRLDPPFPASTFPSQITLATGCYPERHGILNSRFLDSVRGEYERSESPDWIGCEPIWVTAERQGIIAAASNWSGSFGPWRGTRATYSDRSFVGRPDRDTLQRILRWLRLPPASRPRLILATLAGVDHVGHRYGPDAAEVQRRLRAEDRDLDLFLQGLETSRDRDRLALLVVSDHGMATRRGRADPAAALSSRGLRNRTFVSGGSANVYLERESDRPRASDILSRIPGTEVFSSKNLPQDLHYSFPGRTGDLVVVAPVGVELVSGAAGNGPAGGVHGYRGTEDSMGGIFYARGAGIRRGRAVGRIRAVDIYPLMCKLLALRPSSDAQGEIPAGILGDR